MHDFEWDAEKDHANLEKHGISFEEASTIFKGPVLSGPDDSADEYREKSFGLVGGVTLVCVIHTDREGKIRIISARKATANEKKLFNHYLKRSLS
jgi:uncharacterized DUF497 family protein